MLLSPIKISPISIRGGGGGYVNIKSLLLDGSTKAVNIDSILTGISSTTNGCISLWVKIPNTTPASTNTIWSFNDADTLTTIRLILLTTGILRFEAINNGSVRWRKETDSASLTNNIWHHIVCKQNGFGGIIYIDKTIVAQSFTNTTDTAEWFNDLTTLDNARIGCNNTNNNGNNNFTNMYVDEFLYINGSITDSIVEGVYNLGEPKDEKNISGGISYYRMGDASGDNWNNTVPNEWFFKDQIGNNNAQTIAGAEADVKTDTP